MKPEPIPDFTSTEMRVAQETVRERFRGASEVRIDPSGRKLAVCPSLYWCGEDRAQFGLFNTGASRNRLLQAPADHGTRKSAESG